MVNIHEELVDKTSNTTDDINLIHVGDAFWGAKHPAGAIDKAERTQIDIALGNLERWYLLPNLRRAEFVSGTDAHEFEENSALRTLIKELRLSYPNVKTNGSHHALINEDGYWIDVAHKGPYPGSRTWLRGNVAFYYLRDRVMREKMHGYQAPDLYLRAHYHSKVSVVLDQDDKEHRLIVMPSFMMMTGFARGATQSEYEITNGGMYFDVHDGVASSPVWVTKTIDLRRKREWSCQ